MLPRPAGNRQLLISSYPGNTLGAQITILFHELGHIIGRPPEDDDSWDGRSSRNTSEALLHCKTEIHEAAHNSRNITIGAFTTLPELFAKAKAGTPDPGWDFEPDTLRIKKGTPIVVVDQGGEPHTFTEVKNFGGGFIPDLNAGEETVSECSGGFKNVAVARTRILQGSQLLVGDLSKGEHYFQCCIHPWMRVKVEVHDHGTREK